MGDGRYYTYDQLFTIIILVFLIVFITVSLILSYFRNANIKGHRYIIVTLAWQALAVVFKFAEELFMIEQVCEILRSVQAIAILLSYATFALYLLGHYLSSLDLKKSKKVALYITVTMIIAVLLFFTISTGQSFIIKSYDFGYVAYTKKYSIILTSLCVIVFLAMLRVFVKAIKTRKLNKIKFTFGTICILYIVPLIGYIIAVMMGSEFLNIIEIGIIALVTCTMNIVLYSKSSLSITPFSFDKIKSVMEDYVFVTDANGKIVFKNFLAAKSNLFTDSSRLNKDCLQNAFKDHIELRKEHGVEFIVLNLHEQKRFFSFQDSELKDEDITIGSIITFIDITELVEMLNELEMQEKKNRQTNNKLKEYKEIAYDMEKEREINNLLEEIERVQEKNMFDLLERIDHCKAKINDKRFTVYLDETIVYIESNLAEVRRAVTAYSQHYGGN